MCQGLLLAAQLLFAEASMHNEANIVISEYNSVSRAVYYMKEYRKCKKDQKWI